MKTKLLNLLIFVTLVVSIIGAAYQSTAIQASGVGTQNFFISSISQSPNIIINSNSVEDVAPITPTDSVPLLLSTFPRNEVVNVHFSAGNWTGHITLDNMSYSGPITFEIGKYYSGSGPEFYGSATLACGPAGFDFSITASDFTLNQNEYLVFKISGTIDSLDLKIGGTNSYFTSPSGSDWYPDQTVPPLFILSTNASNGTIDSNPRQPAGGYPAETRVTLNASPVDGYIFSHWSGDATGTQNPITVIIDQNETINANFIQNNPAYTLNVFTSPQEGGSVNLDPLPVNGKYAETTLVTLTANPASGYTFSQWDGPVSNPNSFTTTIVMNSDKSVTVTFIPRICEISLGVEPERAGTADTSDHSRAYSYGMTVRVVAVPADGYNFERWEGGVDDPTLADTTIIMDSNKSIIAHFANSQGGFTPATHFVISGYSSPCRVEEPVNFTVMAKNEFDITDINYGGTVTFASSDSAAILPEDAIIINGFGNFSAIFETIGSQTLTAIDTADSSIIGSFDINVIEQSSGPETYILTMNKEGNGAVNPDEGNHTYSGNELVTLSADPDTGWSFYGWSGDLTGSTNPAIITMDKDKEITATFIQSEYTLTINASPATGGIVIKSPDRAFYHYGDTVHLTAYSGSGYTFDSWTGDASGTSTTVNITINSNKSIIALFTENRGWGEGSGGGGGNTRGKLYPDGFISKIPLEMDNSGIIQTPANLTTLDGKVTLNIANKTKLLNKAGSALAIMTVKNAVSPPLVPTGNVLLMSYVFGPDGATFDPAIDMVITYDPKKLPEGVGEADLYLAYFDGSQWQYLASEIDTRAKIITARITHFSVYALIGKIVPPKTPSPTPLLTPSATIKPTVSLSVNAVITSTPTIKPTPIQTLIPKSVPEKSAEPLFNWMLFFLIITFVVVAIVCIIIGIHRKQTAKYVQ